MLNRGPRLKDDFTMENWLRPSKTFLVSHEKGAIHGSLVQRKEILQPSLKELVNPIPLNLNKNLSNNSIDDGLGCGGDHISS